MDNQDNKEILAAMRARLDQWERIPPLQPSDPGYYDYLENAPSPAAFSMTRRVLSILEKMGKSPAGLQVMGSNGILLWWRPFYIAPHHTIVKLEIDLDGDLLFYYEDKEGEWIFDRQPTSTADEYIQKLFETHQEYLTTCDDPSPISL